MLRTAISVVMTTPSVSKKTPVVTKDGASVGTETVSLGENGVFLGTISGAKESGELPVSMGGRVEGTKGRILELVGALGEQFPHQIGYAGTGTEKSISERLFNSWTYSHLDTAKAWLSSPEAKNLPPALLQELNTSRRIAPPTSAAKTSTGAAAPPVSLGLSFPRSRTLKVRNVMVVTKFND